MKTIGLIGGMSWGSTSTYYSFINNEINKRLGGNHSSKCIIYSFDFQEIEELQSAGKWNDLESMLLRASKSLQLAGADCIVVCTNTMHKVVDKIESIIGIPLIHIGDAIGEIIVHDKLNKIGLLGTIFTMEEDFYKKRLKERFGIEVVIPDKKDRQIVNNIIYRELVKGIVNDSSREEYLRIMDVMKSKSVQGIILGCTEIGLLIKQYSCPLYDSTIIHAQKAVEFSLGIGGKS